MRTIFSLEVYCVQNCWRQILKPAKGKSGGGRRHQGVGGEEDDTLVWSERILPCTSLASAGCARASLLCSPLLSFFIPSPPPFSLWPCGVSTLLCRCGFILLFPGGLNFGCVHLSSCRARAAALSSHPYRYPTASSLPASLVISSPGPGTCGLALELPVSMHPRSNSRPTPFIRRQNTSKFNGFR
jgi:hypothetical protein